MSFDSFLKGCVDDCVEGWSEPFAPLVVDDDGEGTLDGYGVCLSLITNLRGEKAWALEVWDEGDLLASDYDDTRAEAVASIRAAVLIAKGAA